MPPRKNDPTGPAPGATSTAHVYVLCPVHAAWGFGLLRRFALRLHAAEYLGRCQARQNADMRAPAEA